MALKCDHMPEVSCGRCDGWAEVRALEEKLAATEQERQNQVKRAEAAESDLRHSDAIRAAMISAASETAKDMLRSIELLEAAFHAGAKFGQSGAFKSIDQAFREWTKENLNREHQRDRQNPTS